MQIYLILWSPGPDGQGALLIGKKQWLNAFWKGKVQDNNLVAVNNAGQYAPIGGGVPKGKDPLAQALTEFKQETGDPGDKLGALELLYQVHDKGPPPKVLYGVAIARMSHEEQTRLLGRLRDAVKPNASKQWCPAGPGVRDWEMQDFLIVPLAKAPELLGKYQAVPPEGWTLGTVKFTKTQIDEKIAEAIRRKASSQSIDWYGHIAQELVRRLSPKPQDRDLLEAT